MGVEREPTCSDDVGPLQGWQDVVVASANGVGQLARRGQPGEDPALKPLPRKQGDAHNNPHAKRRTGRCELPGVQRTFLTTSHWDVSQVVGTTYPMHVLRARDPAADSRRKVTPPSSVV